MAEGVNEAAAVLVTSLVSVGASVATGEAVASIVAVDVGGTSVALAGI